MQSCCKCHRVLDSSKDWPWPALAWHPYWFPPKRRYDAYCYECVTKLWLDWKKRQLNRMWSNSNESKQVDNDNETNTVVISNSNNISE